MLPQMSGALQRKMELTDEYLQSLEARANIKLNEIKEHKMDADDQADFADYIKLLYNTHRYYHVIIAADFYRAMFNQGDYPVDMQNEVNTSLEINEQVSQGIEVFKYNASKGTSPPPPPSCRPPSSATNLIPACRACPATKRKRSAISSPSSTCSRTRSRCATSSRSTASSPRSRRSPADFDATKP